MTINEDHTQTDLIRDESGLRRRLQRLQRIEEEWW
jgi:phosphate starvation-inducible protein PhoH